ncbi:MAG: FAD-dependent oxidoreductase [Ruminococcus sp.]|jgi:NAD(P)H-nitrite reductase large subunit|nr:FAD-dependent oxidoreductase [Ruminococcus sp.]
MKINIIGNSHAAVGCIEAVRKYDKDAEITVFSDENYSVYSRPLISYLLYGKTTLEKMKYRPDSFYEENNVKLILNKHIDNVDDVKADKVLIATGSRPFLPPMNGYDTVEKKFGFMTLDDALSLEKELSVEKDVLVIGAGLIGLKCVEGILDKVKSVTVVDLADRILPSILDEQGSALVKKFLEMKKVKFILNTSVDTFNKNTATLKNGDKLNFDILVTAVGVRPNTELFSGEKNRGIVVDALQKTSVANVYAAGDCTERDGKVLALLPNAYIGGYNAGLDMVGKSDEAKPVDYAMNAIGFFGYHIGTAGEYVGDEYIESEGMSYKKLFIENNILKGFIIIGDLSRCGIYTQLIRDKVDLSSVDFDLIKKKPQLAAFGKTYRKEVLGK